MDKLRRRTILLGTLLSICPLIVHAQTSIAASVYGAYRSSTQASDAANNSVSAESPSNALGASIDLQHIRSPLIGYDFTYSYQNAEQNYQYYVRTRPCSSGATSSTETCSQSMEATIPVNTHEIVADWVFSLHRGNLRPFVFLGGGLLLDAPATSNAAVSSALTQCLPGKPNPACTITLTPTTFHTQMQTQGVLDYGVGLDWAILRHVGLRFQYRGDLHKTAALIKKFPSTAKFTQDFKPEIGLVFRF